MARRKKQTLHKEVRFSCSVADAARVHLAGTFNEWDPLMIPMMKDADGVWFVELALPTGRHEYKFLVDGKWCCEPGRPDNCRESHGCVCNEHGTMNRVIEVI